MYKRYLVIVSIVSLLSTTGFVIKSAYDPSTDPLVINRDMTVNPADDIFEYAFGTWFKKNPIPASESSNGIWKMVQDSVNKAVLDICQKASAKKGVAYGSTEQKIGDMYFSGMDTVSIEKNGINALKIEFIKIKGIKNIPGLLSSVAHLQTLGVGALYSFYVGRDDKNSSKYQCFLWQGGLGLPDRDYYFNTDSRTKTIRDEYIKHISKMLYLSDNYPKADADNKRAKAVLELETGLAKVSRKLEDIRDPYANYNKKTIDEVNKITPAIEWKNHLEQLGIKNADSLILGQPEFLSGINTLLTSVNLETWKDYLQWQLINTYASSLTKEIDVENFKFYSTILSGTKEQRPRWKRVVENTNSALGELIGQIYVKEYLPSNTKQKLTEIGTNIMEVYKEHIQKLDWMSSDTKKKALVKLSKVTMKLGYPDKWKDYTALRIDHNSYITNNINVNKWKYTYMINHYGKPMDRTEWNMFPQTYNAYYEPTNNEIVIPACNIIVPGYSGLPDDAVLYGVVGGSTFGHEITHGFDDQGRLYDQYGNLHNWWTNEDSIKFTIKAQRMINQFDGYTILDGKYHVNGKASLGENIADLGGVIMGFEAFKRTEEYKKGEKMGGLTPAQRYFLGYTYSWMVHTRDEQLARQIMSDVHSPPKFRVLGPLSNITDFYQAFNVKPGNKMYRADSVRVSIW